MSQSRSTFCGPLPEYTDLETGLLKAFAAHQGDNEQTFRRQLSASKVVSRENTIAGFYTNVEIDKTRCAPMAIHDRSHGHWVNGGGGHLEVEGYELGIGAYIWFKDGFLDCIEGFTYGFDAEMPPQLADLKLKGVELS